MAQDLIYYFVGNRKYELGEIQSDFNMSIVIDGTKDSLQVDVYSFVRDAIKPNTIIWHSNTNTWWVVQKDQVKRNANEQGFYYNHSLTLLGAIDLLKNRDLTDCGFNGGCYTIDTFLKKLFKLSNFEFDIYFNYGNNVDKDQIVKHIKSYENYTLLSALRDFLNDYNCDAKLVFNLVSPTLQYFTSAQLKIIPRTGNVDLTPVSIDTFEDIRESINSDKESFGTTVISNAQNVVSSLAKTYPQIGGVRVTGTDYNTNYNTAYIKLPSPAFKVNWAKAITPAYIVCMVGARSIATEKRYLESDYSAERVLDELLEAVKNDAQVTDIAKEHIYELLSLGSESRTLIRQTLMASTRITFFNNPSYNPRTNLLIKESTTPYIPTLINEDTDVSKEVCLMDKESRDLLYDTRKAIYWERGSDKIQGLGEAFGSDGVHWNTSETRNDMILYGFKPLVYRYDGGLTIRFGIADYDHYYDNHYVYNAISKSGNIWQVNYIPLSDIKIKQDNENNTNDIQLYNQNGKLNDSVALSKMIDSYSKEIKNPTITRYMHYTNFSDIPQIGQIVSDGEIKYVINNISYNFYMCESNSVDTNNYYIECEFTLAPYISTKSIMTSPNTNVRDYGIPQKYNVKRRQTYRDYYEFSFEEDSNANEYKPYTKLENYLSFDYNVTNNTFDHVALIKIDYENLVDGEQSWYYQLSSIVQILNKSLYETIDFEDNNIIGYDIQSTSTGFTMNDLWNSNYVAVTTPISYVDDNGRFKGITLQMANSDVISIDYAQINTGNNAVAFSSHCFIGQQIYDNVANGDMYTSIKELNNFVLGNVGVNPNGYLQTPPHSITREQLGIPNNVDLDTIVVTKVEYIKTNDEEDTYHNTTSFSVTKYDNLIDLSFVDTNNTDATFVGTSLSVRVFYKWKYGVNMADYVINEQNYDKDAIEVPVFEYSLQFGDTNQVEIGDNILKTIEGKCVMFSYAVISEEEITMLNYGKYTNLAKCVATGGRYIDGERNFRVTCAYALMNFEDYNDLKVLRIKFYDSRTAYFIGDENQDTIGLDHIEDLTGVPQRNVKNNKALVIFRNTIKNMKHDDVENTNELDYEQDIMFIIHNPPNSAFDGNDLILYANYYKLN